MSLSAVREGLLDFAWGAWAGMGPKALAPPTPWVVDPEPLLILTSGLIKHDRRLQEVALDWIADSSTRISQARLRNLSMRWKPSGLDTLTSPLKREQSESQTNRDNSISQRPGAFGLRLRASLGLGARTEILRALISNVVPTPATALALANEAGYQKRSVADALAGLVMGGALTADLEGNTFRYRLEHASQWQSIFGPVPGEGVSFLAAARSTLTLWSILEIASDESPAVRSVEARRAIEAALPDLRSLSLRPPDPPPGESAWQPVLSWTEELLTWLRTGGRRPRALL